MRSAATPEQIMEELADRVIAQIDRRAPTGFENALDELTEYHSFLLELYATRSDSGAPLSYAELGDDTWHQPHDRWIRQYRRLFDRAAERIPDGHRFIETLCYVQGRLLGSKWGDRLSPNVIASILDMQPILMHAVEAWVTRRSILEADEHGAAKRFKLTGSDATSLASAMHGVVGAWESHLTIVSSSYGWSKVAGMEPAELWSRYALAWPFLRQHVAHTAYSLAVAVWNGDAISANLFREALVRWPGSALIDLQRDGLAQHPWLLMPSLIEMPWAEVSARPEADGAQFLDGPFPDSTFAELVDGLRNDVVLVIASLMLAWSREEGPVGGLASDVARALVSGRGSDLTEAQHNGFDFDRIVRGLIRLQLVGERFEDASHGGWLDGLVRRLDTMREKAVVPGRVYSPTTMHDREQLLFGDMAMLAAFAPKELPHSVSRAIEAIADDPTLLPSDDRSLRAILAELDRYRNTIDQDIEAFSAAITAVSPEADPNDAIENFRSVVEGMRTAIQDRRLQRLRDAPVDEEAIEALRSKAEEELLKSPADVPIFDDVEVFLLDGHEGEPGQVRINGVQKGRFVRPPMEQESLNFSEVMARHVREGAGKYVLNAFSHIPKEEIWIYAQLSNPQFWIELSDAAKAVGDRPVLVVSHQDSIEHLGWRTLRGDGPLAKLDVKSDQGSRERGRYVATIESVEVFAMNIEPGTAWLTSARLLKRLGYAPTDGGRVSLKYEGDDGEQAISGSLVFEFSQQMEWGLEPTFIVRFG
ncbi:MAG: hypothetical protein G9473_06900 [Erythrobacter sp.]|nr:MAG: hypothetical protein G9473_06900 [Erythrobacter sp.]